MAGPGCYDAGVLLLTSIALAGTLVLPLNSERLVERARLVPEVVTEADVRELFVRDGANNPALPSQGMLDDLVALADHPDKHVRRQIPDAIQPWFATHTQGPLPDGHDLVVREDIIVQLAHDTDTGVRRKTAALYKEIRPNLATPAIGVALLELTHDDNRGVRRAALASLAEAPRQGILSGPVTWMRAMDAVRLTKGDGRTACNTLAKLHRDVQQSDIVNPNVAVSRCILYHPEHAWGVWNAWREEVPFDPNQADGLLNDTIGWSGSLGRHWAKTDPEAFATVLAHWHPDDPERLQMVKDSLIFSKEPAIRGALGLDPDHTREVLPEGEVDVLPFALPED